MNISEDQYYGDIAKKHRKQEKKKKEKKEAAELERAKRGPTTYVTMTEAMKRKQKDYVEEEKEDTGHISPKIKEGKNKIEESFRSSFQAMKERGNLLGRVAQTLGQRAARIT